MIRKIFVPKLLSKTVFNGSVSINSSGIYLEISKHSVNVAPVLEKLITLYHLLIDKQVVQLTDFCNNDYWDFTEFIMVCNIYKAMVTKCDALIFIFICFKMTLKSFSKLCN